MYVTTIPFDKQPWLDSIGERTIRTGGLAIFVQARGARSNGSDDAILLNPVNGNGSIVRNCRIGIARAALPRIVAVLQDIIAGRTGGVEPDETIGHADDCSSGRAGDVSIAGLDPGKGFFCAECGRFLPNS